MLVHVAETLLKVNTISGDEFRDIYNEVTVVEAEEINDSDDDTKKPDAAGLNVGSEKTGKVTGRAIEA